MSSEANAKSDDPLLSPGSIEEAAASWLARIDAGLSTEEAVALSAWRSADPRHEAELAKLELIWRELEGLKPAKTTVAGEAIRFPPVAKPGRRRSIAFPIAAMAAAASIVVGLTLWQRSSSNPGSGESGLTAVNYQVVRSARLVTLPDGSLVDLKGDSQIETEFTATERRVRLVRGEAYFAVTKNPDRPFLVSVSTATVRAVGTAFGIKAGAADIEVLVTEGKVRLDRAPDRDPAPGGKPSEAPILVKGQRASWGLNADGLAPSIANLSENDIKAALEWRATRLTFDSTPLKDAFAAFNRYNTTKLQLGDANLDARTLTGEFRADNLEGFVWALPMIADVAIEHVRDDLIVIKSKH